MQFSRSIMPLKEGRVTDCYAEGTDIIFLTALEGGVAQRRLNYKRAKENIISYADECYYLGGQLVHRNGNELSYAN